MEVGVLFSLLESGGSCMSKTNLKSLNSKKRFSTILADPPWRFTNRTGKMAPEHKRLKRYETMSIKEICELPVEGLAQENSHLYLWCPNTLLPWGLRVMEQWGISV